MKKKIIFLLFVFLIFNFNFTCFAEEISLPVTVAVSFQSTTNIRVYPLSGSNTSYRVFTASGSDLNNNNLYITGVGTSSNDVFVRVCSSSSASLPSFNRPTSASSSVSFSSKVLTSGTYSIGNGESVAVDLVQNYDDDLYYYFFTEKRSVTMKMVSNDLPEPTSTPISSPAPSAAPSVAPSAAPSASPAATLDGYTFYTYCFDQTVKLDETSSQTSVIRSVPSQSSDFSDVDLGIFNYVYTYPVRIPFRVTTDFRGVGYIDTFYSFDLDAKFFGVDGYGSSSGPSASDPNAMVDFSTPWVESADGSSFNAITSVSSNSRYPNGMDVINLPLFNGSSGEFYFCFNVYLSLVSNHHISNIADYMDLSISNINFQIAESTKISDTSSEEILEQIRDEQKKQDDLENERYEEEQDKISEAEDSITDGAGKLTETLSAWEIFTMPFKLLQDFVGAIASEGDTGLTFPSFTLMGHELWPSYTFDLKVIAEKFPALYNALHLITGIMVVSWFIHYCWRKWHILVGDDMPEN